MNELTWQPWAEQLATGIALVGADLRVRWINSALAERLALGARSLIGQPLTVWMPDAAERGQIQRLQAGAAPMQWRDVTLITPDGRTVRADILAQHLDDELLLEVHVLAEPWPSASPLSATLRGFAHEVKNPLAGLRGAAQLLQRRVESDDLRSLAGLIIGEADRLAALANRLLHHDGAAPFGPVNIHQLLERLTDLLQAEPSSPQLRHDYDPSVPDLPGDADGLQQLLLNLARNAVEANAKTLTLRTRIEHGVRVGERMARTALRVDVIDDGAGVPATLRDTLFEPLVSGRVDGTGLGLALSREIAHAHRGELRCSSRAGHTVLSLYLPLEHTHD